MKPYFSAILLMGGQGARMRSSLPKQFHRLGDEMVYQVTLKTFIASSLFDEIILVCHADWLPQVIQATARFSEVKVVASGPTRQASSYQGLKACHPLCSYVMIHDAVRPFVSHEILKRNYEAVLTYAAVDTCIESPDTLVTCHQDLWVSSIPPRSGFRRGQTPQTFAYSLIYEAHETTTTQNATDDCQLVLAKGCPVKIVQGSEENMKITTEWDLKIAQFLYQKQHYIF